MAGIEAMNPQEVVQTLQEVGQLLIAPALLGGIAYFRARRLGKKGRGSDETRAKLKEINGQIDEVKAQEKANAALIHSYNQIEGTTSQNQKAIARQSFVKLIKDENPEEWASLKPKQREDYVSDRTAEIQSLSEGQAMAFLKEQRNALMGQVGKGMVIQNLQRTRGFLTNEVRQTIEATVMGIGIDVLRFPAMDALARGISWYNGEASLVEKGLLTFEVTGLIAAAYLLWDRAINVHPGK